MNCDQASQIHRYHDGELSAAQRASVEAHLGRCAECRGLLADLRRLSFAIGHARMRPLSAQTAGRLQQSWKIARDRGVIRLAEWLTAAAAAVLITVLLTKPGSQRGDLAGQPAVWEMVATTPPTDAQEDSGADVAGMAQWMADELAQTSRQ